MASQNEIRERVTRTIIEALEKGGLPPWRKPWRNDHACGSPTNIVSGKKYRGINPLLLNVAAMHHGFLSTTHWGTFRQWKELGGQVKKRPDNVPAGDWGTQIIYYSPISKTRKDDDGSEHEERFFILKTYTVFNIDQVEGSHLDHLRAGHGEVEVSDPDYLEVRRVVDATGAEVRLGGNQAYYRMDLDHIQMPNPSQCDTSEWYLTLLHELVHWAQAQLNPKANWEDGRAGQELVAEIGSCFLAAELGIPMSDDMTNHVAYVKSWLRSLKNDSRYIFTASAQAAKAADYILSFSRATEPEEVLAE